MFEILAGILAGLMVKHWTAFFVFPCIIGLIQTVALALRPRRLRVTPAQLARMRDAGMNDDDIHKAQEGLALLNRMAPSGLLIYVWQFVWSSVTAFPFCLIVGGLKLLLF